MLHLVVPVVDKRHLVELEEGMLTHRTADSHQPAAPSADMLRKRVGILVFGLGTQALGLDIPEQLDIDQ